MPKQSRSPPRELDPSDALGPHELIGGSPPEAVRFPIIGLGASMIGLQALNLFLQNIPLGSGAAFIIAQHLDPNDESLLVDTLQRSSTIPVHAITEGMAVAPEHVYVIPPDHDLALAQGVMHLLVARQPDDQRQRIDDFFISLAKDQREHGVAVILPGAGSDGTRGLKAIKEHAGLTAAQESTAIDLDGTQGAEITVGTVDLIAPADQLLACILATIQGTAIRRRFVLAAADPDKVLLAGILLLLRQQTGHDFSRSRKTALYGRIERRMAFRHISSLNDYLDLLRKDPTEGALLSEQLLIGLTRFFRNPEVWTQLRCEIIPALLAAKPEGGTLRAWSIGCSNGEEAYALAMTFQEALEQAQPRATFTIQIFATDLNATAVERARHGLYPPSIATAISPERLRRFFVEDVRGYRVRKEIRDMVVLAQHSLLADPLFIKLDILSCRNAQLDLTPDVQDRLLPRFHSSLNAGGILLLRHGASVGAAGHLFTPLASTGQLYRRVDAPPPSSMGVNAAPVRAVTPPGRRTHPMAAHVMANLQTLADQLLLQRYAPAAVLVARNGDILHVSGNTGKYLNPAGGQTNWNVLAMVREGLCTSLSEAFYEAQRKNDTVTLAAVLTDYEGEIRNVDITVQRLANPALQGMLMVVFADVTTAPNAEALDKNERKERQGERQRSMERALNDLSDELRKNRREAQTYREEMVSYNDELQAANDELTATTEELRSLNEELLYARAAADGSLARYTDLFASAPVGYVTIDRAGVITQANLVAVELLGQVRDPSSGGLLALFVIEADRPVFNACRDQAIANRAAQECEVALAQTAMPRTMRITIQAADDGRTCRVVLVDISKIRQAEAALRESEERFRNLANHAPLLIRISGVDKRCATFNQGWLDFTGQALEQEVGKAWGEGIHDDDRPRCLEAYGTAFDAQDSFGMEYRLRRHDGELRWLLATASPRFTTNGTFQGYLETCVDITERKQAEMVQNHERTILEAVAQGGRLSDLLTLLVLSFETLMPNVRGTVSLLDQEARRLHLAAAPNLPTGFRAAIEEIEIMPSTGSCAAAAHTGKPVMVADIANDPSWRAARDVALAHGVRACWSAPILGTARQVLGTLALYFTVPRAALPAEMALMERGAHLASLAIERQQTEVVLATTTEMLTRTGSLAKIGGWRLDLATMKVLWSMEVFHIHELDPPVMPNLDEMMHFFRPEALPVVRDMLRDGIEHGKPWDLELPLTTAKGRNIWVRVQGTAELENGKAIRLHGTLQDITARKAMADDLRQAHKLEAVGRLAGGVAHDFNNQLTVIQGYSTMALAKTQDQDLTKYLTQVAKAAKRSADLVRQLLTFSRKGNHLITPVDMRDLITDLMEVLGRSLNKLIRLRSTFATGDTVVMGDAGLLQNAFLNLALNGRDAMPAGGELCFATAMVDLDDVRVSHYGGNLAPGPYLQITVSDTGVGMSDEVQKHLFEPFFSTKGPGLGTGLGLASVYGTVTLLRGIIEVDSAMGRGTTFRVFLPCALQAAAKPATAAVSPPPAVAATSAHVLVIDDEESVACFVTDSLADLGHEVVCKQDGALGLEHYRLHWRETDLILLDMNMPNMSGPETFNALRQINPQAKVLIMSGFSADGGVKDLIAKGALGFIAKPFLPEALALQVGQALRAMI